MRGARYKGCVRLQVRWNIGQLVYVGILGKDWLSSKIGGDAALEFEAQA